MSLNNKVSLKFLSKSVNESLARNVAGIFAIQFNPTLADISDIKTAVSEGVTNSIVHGYPNGEGEIELELIREDNVLHINIFDKGVGIENVNKALEPFYTTREDEERSGMGFTIMKSFMDDVNVVSKSGEGVKVYMSKIFNTEQKGINVK